MELTKIVLISTLLALAIALPNGRIIGGQTAKAGQFPYVVSIMVEDVFTQGNNCAATIIGSQWLLTTASCVITFSLDKYYVRADTISLGTSGTNYTLSSLFVHPNYTGVYYTDNIALVKVDREIELSETAQIIEIDDAKANETCILLGWGNTATIVDPDLLQFAEVSALDDNDCKRLQQGALIERDIGPGQFCGFNFDEQVAPCYGDSGSPLVCHDKLVGFMSFAIQPCSVEFPNVYTKVQHYAEWIDEIIGNN